jgi:solute carrier family 8 (sodium/calcium exchanger)
MAAGVFISGNNFGKLSLFKDFFGLGFISKTTYNRMQAHFVIPEITRYWEQMKNEIWDILSDESVILCGDGRNDSSGHSAKYCMYASMEQHLDLIVDVEVVDKRQTKGISTNMEVFGLKTILERMVGKIIISEVVTDASAAIIALVRKMKGNECLKF